MSIHPRIRQMDTVLPAEAMLAKSSPHVVDEKIDEEYASAPEWTFPDGGLRAWSIVLGCFLFTCTCMYVEPVKPGRQLTDHRGFSLVWGALQDYYHTHMFPDASLSTISLVGGVQNFVRRSKVHSLLDLLSPRLWAFRRTLPAALVIDSTSS